MSANRAFVKLPNDLIRFASYDEWRKTTDVSNDSRDLVYPALGVNGEAGELAEKVKKLIRDNHCQLTDDIRRLILLECGDVLWYVAQMAHRLGSSLGEVALMNVDKLESRKERGVLRGSGDDR
jgi:NTP pyrophosphatase (non-canonical NTP hydrolase)